MAGAYLIGLSVGKAWTGARRLLGRAYDRAWLALLDLDAALEARIEGVEERLGELRDGVTDWHRAGDK